MERFYIQDNQYMFPYHYLPSYNSGKISRKRELDWGIEYLSYLKFVIDRIMAQKPLSVLDVGCGDGRFLNILKETKRIKEMKGIDLSERAIMLAKAMNKDIDFEVKDIKNEEKKFDAIACIEVLEHIPEDELKGFLSGIRSALQKSGRVFITVPSINIPLNPKHYRHYSIKLLEEQLQKSNSGLIIEEYHYIVPLPVMVDKIGGKLLNNRFYELKFYDKWRWKRLWRRDLIATEENGTHIFAILKPIEK